MNVNFRAIARMNYWVVGELKRRLAREVMSVFVA